MKKVFKIIGITLLIIVILLVSIPFIFQGKIKDIVKNTINNNVNAHVEFSDINLSFIRSFPQAQVDVSDLEITNFAPFKDEKLASVKSISLTMSIKELFKKPSEGPVIINKFKINQALIVLKTNKHGETNYDIAKESENQDSESTNSFSLDVQDYSIDDSALTYIDESSDIIFFITELNHSGKGKFSENVSELDTETFARVTLKMDSTEYLSNNILKLDAIIGLDLPNNKYSFKKNKAFINDLPLEFQGYFQLLETGQEIDITFENPGSDFKEFLAVIPKTYSKDIEKVETSGDFKISGRINGLISEETIPQMDINIVSNNASFKYPDLPKRVDNININTSIKNTTGKAEDTYVDISKLNFKIDNDQFQATAKLGNLTKNMTVEAYIDGILNLANISKAYPIELDTDLSGILKAKINTAFDMKAIETNAYERIKSTGSVQVSDFVYASEDMLNPINISNADLTFQTGTVALNRFEAKSGQSDINANGTITNLLGFLLSDKKLQGHFNVNSNTFNVSDFMVPDSDEDVANAKKTGTSTPLKIPAFLDCTINADAKTVIYDNLTLKNTKGNLAIKDQTATLNNLTTNLFKGTLAVSGDINTQKDVPHFNLKLNANSFDITESFNTLDLLKALAPIAKIFEGKLNTEIALNGSLDNSFSPILSTVSGNALAELLTTKTKIENSPLLNALDSKLSFIDLDKLNLDDLKTILTFNDGKVNIQPFHIAYKDIDIAIGGSHGFDQSMDYNIAFNVPAKYLGSDINRLIGKINDSEVNKISIPITANVKGSFDNPNISTDLSSSISNLTKQLIEIEKQKLINQGTNAVKDLIGGMISGNNPSPGSTPKDTTGVKTDSTKVTPPTAEDAIKNILGGFIKKNKDKNKTKKDSIN
ncbi:AsmA family protein [Bizionia myxarmorum]|uniref:AsmA family protein n=1 Tax=Bizionia myxarmorum TaxID=291186 RepID=A0A5D0RBT6_9FLAO|nr:AsmA family protein [Bizionia myxarmorum]TYB78356.1 AsmA family protein [Bizionia myxarmorum]